MGNVLDLPNPLFVAARILSVPLTFPLTLSLPLGLALRASMSSISPSKISRALTGSAQLDTRL